ncbi:MAG: T9SS type A sorting domain-containing protein [Flavobacteriales bacterium]|nr:T9SS type A sorting domain-containing protein [Flavobacteriales bacterium]
MPDVVIEVQPGPVYTNTNNSGQYDAGLFNGNYTAELLSAVVEEHCINAPIPFTIAGNTSTVNLASISLVPLDARIALSSGPARPGFEYHLGLSARNLTPAASGAVTIAMDYDPALGFISAEPPPNTVSGNTLTWDQPQFTPFQQRSIQVRFQVPPDVGLIGTDLITTASVTTVNADADPTNNTATIQQTVTGSFDPNDKLATTSTRLSDALYFINEDQWIDYTIRFQNTGTDTAFHVIITDTLPATLDPATLEMGAASHAFTWQLRDQGTLKFRFFDILLPDSNVNEAASHGFVSFRIRPRPPLFPGTVIENTANIYFDYNPPVITEPSVLVAEFSTHVDGAEPSSDLVLMPNPTADLIPIVGHVGQWSGAIWRIVAADGRIVLAGRGAEGRATIDVRDLPSALYTLTLVASDGVHSSRFIKTDQP